MPNVKKGFYFRATGYGAEEDVATDDNIMRMYRRTSSLRW